MVLQEPRFFARNTRLLSWQVILCVDQSGSMADSVIHSAVMAGILAGLPLVRVKIVVFDTSVVDLSGHVDDPVKVLMSVQLGGGTNIGAALAYCEGRLRTPIARCWPWSVTFAKGRRPTRCSPLARGCMRPE